MRPNVGFVLLLAFVILGASGCDDDPLPDSNSCAKVTCLRGEECQKGKCVERVDPEPEGCSSNEDCLFHPVGELCERSTGKCVACFTTDHCADGRVCDEGACAGEVCTYHADCEEEDAPFCNPAGDACVACLGDGDCEDGICVAGSCEPIPPACVEDADCGDAAKPFCVNGDCASCRDDSICAEGEGCSGAGVCAPNACTDTSDCTAFPDRTCRGGACAVGNCDTAMDCADPGKPYCAANHCVACTATEGCPAGMACGAGAVCEAIACVDLMDCPIGSTCEDGSCEGVAACTDGADCKDPRAPVCAPDGSCVTCLGNADCGAWEMCNQGVCSPFDTCRSNADCRGGFVCSEEACVSCISDEQCPRGTCMGGACVDVPACSSSADCSAGSCSDGSCVACTWDQDCQTGFWCEAGACVTGSTCGDGSPCPVGSQCEEGVCAPASCDDDAFEPDQGPAGARPLQLRIPVSRTLCHGDEDWFTFTAPAGAAVDATLLQGPEGLDLSLVWYQNDGSRRRMERAGVGGVWAGALPEAAASRYYLRVRSASGATGAYTLLAAPATASCVDGFEPNDTIGAAVPLPAGQLFEDLHVCGPADFYSLTVPANQTMEIFVFFSDGTLNTHLFSAAGSQVPMEATPITDPRPGRRLRLAADPADRTFSFRATSPTGQRPSSYSLFFALEAGATCGSGPELLALGEGRGRVQGTTLGANDPRASFCGALQRHRTYLLHLEEDSRIVAHVDATFPPRLALYNANCSSSVACQGGFSGKGTLDVAHLDAGTYVLAVGSEGPQGFFDLAVRVLPPADPPANNLCTDPIPVDLTSVTTLQGSTTGATANIASSCGGLSPDVFYSFVLTEEMRAVFDLENHTAPLAMFVLDGACAPVAGICGAAPRLDVQLPGGAYRLGISSTSGEGTDFRLTGRSIKTPGNDTCAAAQNLTVGSSVQGDTTWATDQQRYLISESCTGYLVNGHDLFYRVTLTEGVPVTITVTPETGYDAAVYVMGDCAEAQCLAGADENLKGGVEQFVFTPSRTGAHLIVVDGAKDGGPFTLQVE